MIRKDLKKIFKIVLKTNNACINNKTQEIAISERSKYFANTIINVRKSGDANVQRKSNAINIKPYQKKKKKKHE